MDTYPDLEVEQVPGSETAEELSLTTNIYAEIRRRLVARGVPPEQVAFIHDAKTPEARAKLFAAVNAGQIRVLIGSTEKMGTGMNAQQRLVAVHQITPPWRPGDIEQQTGRMIRQGNLYPQVFQFVYVTESSFDGYTWQLLENKAGFIGQIASGQVTSREVEDVNENVLTFSEIKALASGNPDVIRKVVLDNELARLSAVRHSWQASQFQAQNRINHQVQLAAEAGQDIAVLQAAIETRDANRSEKFAIILRRNLYEPGDDVITDRETAGKRLRALAAGALMKLLSEHVEWVEIGSCRGLALKCALTRSATGEPQPLIYFKAGRYIFQVNIAESDAGATLSLDAKLRALDVELENARTRLVVAHNNIAQLEAELARPWEHEERYTALQAQAAELAKALDAANIQMDAPEAKIADETESIARSKVQVALTLTALEALHRDPRVLERFGLAGEPDDAPIDVTLETAADPAAEIEQQQAQLAFVQAVLDAVPHGQTVQLELFGGFAAPAPTRRRRR